MISHTWFAIAVRDAAELWLYLEIKRHRESDVYVFWSYERQRQLHISYHKDGRWYATSYDDDPRGGHRQQRPDVMLRGSERVVTTPIHLSGVRALNTPCRGARSGDKFTGIFEISADLISPERVQYTTCLAIDIAEPGVTPPVPKVVRRVVFADAVPHIHVSLWDPTDFMTRLERERVGLAPDKQPGEQR